MIRRALVVGIHILGDELVEVVEGVEQLRGALVHAGFGHSVGIIGHFDAVVGVGTAVGDDALGTLCACVNANSR